MKKRLFSILLALCMVLCLVPTTAFAESETEEPPVCSCETACTAEAMNADCPICGVEWADPENCKCATVESEQKVASVSTSFFPTDDLVDPVIRIHLSPWGDGYYSVPNGTWTAADFFQPGKAPKGAKITAVTPPTSPSIPVKVNVDSDGTLSCTKTENTTQSVLKSETYTVTITSDDYASISAPLTVRQYLDADFRGPIYFNDRLFYGDTYTYTCRVNNPGENGVWSALIQDPQMFEIYKETTDTTSEPGKSIYTVHIRAIKAGARVTCIDFLYLSDTTIASSKDYSTAITGGAVRTRPLTVTAGSATITEGDALPTDLVSCTGLLDSEGRKDDRDTVLENALSYRLLDASGVEVAADMARNTPGTYTVVPAATLQSGWEERYALRSVNGTLTVEKRVDEQFTLTPGGTYYFDLSGESIPGTANSGNSYGAASLPDTSLHYVPFTYAGTIEAYKLTSEMATTEEYAQQNKYPHSLFVADYVVTHTVSWNDLDTASLIFGKDYASSGVDYTLRAPSVGSNYTGSGNSERGTPKSNEWDTMLNKNSGYIQNWNKMYLWGQDTVSGDASSRARRGYSSARYWYSNSATLSNPSLGFRPVLEVLNPDTLGSDGLKVVTLDLNGGKLGGSSDAIQIIVKNGSTFTAPMSGGLTRPDGDTGSYFMWLGSDGKLYAPGASVPADVTKLTAQWRDIAVPTGEIKIAENGWKSFFNTITFGLFFKDAQTVTVTAADNSGETVTIEYLLSEKALTESELASMTFTAYSAPFSINPDNKYVIYAKLTDTSGNVAYINTNGIVLDATVPGISGIADGKTYCAAQIVTVDEKYIGTVKVNGTEVSLDENSQFALSPASGEQTIVVTDKAGNETKVTVTVNDGHTYEWQSENGQYWQKCKFCNHETAKKDIPTINISGADKVCRTQDYKFSFTLPEGATDAACGYEFIGLGGAPLTPTVENGLYSGIIKASTYPAKENIFKLIVSVKTADGFAFSAEKKVTIQNEHTGGTATCKDKAKCGVCGESYGKLDPNNHANLKHIDAKAATKTSEGNIEYWYCDGCNKYYKDAKATQEITKAQTVTAKLPDDSKSSQTGDNSNLALWIALLFISGGAVTVTTVYGRKKKRLTK